MKQITHLKKASIFTFGSIDSIANTKILVLSGNYRLPKNNSKSVILLDRSPTCSLLTHDSFSLYSMSTKLFSQGHSFPQQQWREINLRIPVEMVLENSP